MGTEAAGFASERYPKGLTAHFADYVLPASKGSA